MSKEFSRVGLITGLLVIALPLTMLGGGFESYLLGMGLTALGFACVMFFLGIILLLPKSSRNYGKAVLLTSGLLLLASFTLCSSTGSL